jgi:hypothetical protein
VRYLSIAVAAFVFFTPPRMVCADEKRPPPTGRLSIRCNGDATEQIYLNDAGDSRIVDGMRKITRAVIHKIPIESISARRAGVRVNGEVKLECSSDGEHWAIMFYNYGLGALSDMSAGVLDSEATQAAKTGALWVRISPTTQSCTLERVDFWAEGATLLTDFAPVHEASRAGRYAAGVLMAVVGLLAFVFSQRVFHRK